MSGFFYREAQDGGDNGVWAGFEQPQNRNSIGLNSCTLYDDSGVLKLKKGRFGLDNDSNKGTVVITVEEIIDMSGVSNSNWTKIEVSVSGSAITISATDISGATDETVIPTNYTGAYDGSKHSFYIDSTKRCIGLAWMNAGGTLEGVVNSLNGESFIGYSTSDDANDYVYKFLMLNGFEPDYFNKDAPQTVNEDVEFTGEVDLSEASVTLRSIDSLAANNYSLVGTVAHGESFTPIVIAACMVCITAELGFVAGDEVSIAYGAVSATRQVQITPDANNFVIAMRNAAAIAHKTTGNWSNITPANWKFRIRYV